MNEVWKDIKGFEGEYQISNTGKVKSVKHGKELILKPYKDKDGYPIVGLLKNGERTIRKIHRLVGIHFVPNPDGLLFINHKDETVFNNHVDNLEWCTKSYNNNYGTVNERKSIAEGKPVVQKTLQGETIKTYHAAKEAERITGIPRQNIGQCCIGRYNTAGNYKWEYAQQSEVI